jgi:hypothetical protein
MQWHAPLPSVARPEMLLTMMEVLHAAYAREESATLLAREDEGKIDALLAGARAHAVG